MYTVHACICAFFKHRYSETIIIVTIIKQYIKPTECKIAISNNKTLCVCVLYITKTLCVHQYNASNHICVTTVIVIDYSESLYKCRAAEQTVWA